MSEQPVGDRSGSVASRALGGKLDSIPFSLYHVIVILVLALVGFIEATIWRSLAR